VLRLLVATNNLGKLREYRQLLRGVPAEFVAPADLGLALEVHETGATFADNARLKAEAFASASGLATLADDSGLEVDALGGEPGVRSARYGGPGRSDEARYRLVLDRLAGVKWEDRGARFRCVIALAPLSHAGSALPSISFAEGLCEGFIARAARGAGGFGYDPVFYVPEYGLTMAELATEAKNRISHRARAVQAIRGVLMNHFRGESQPIAGPPRMLSEVRFRRFRAEDVGSLAECCGLTARELQQSLADERAGAPPALVAELGGEPVAFGALGQNRGGRVSIRLLVVSPVAVEGIDPVLRRVLTEVARDRGVELC
jgi:XTP/dITP diphosphohydrolase